MQSAFHLLQMYSALDSLIVLFGPPILIDAVCIVFWHSSNFILCYAIVFDRGRPNPSTHTLYDMAHFIMSYAIVDDRGRPD